MIYNLINIILFFNINVFAYHPVHISVSNIDFNASQKSFDISIKVFADDFEKAVSNSQIIKSSLGESNQVEYYNEKIKSYINKNFKFILNNKDSYSNKNLILTNHKIEDGAIWLYFTFKVNEKIKSIKIINNLLNDLYPDMTNLVIVKYKDLENGYTLNKNNNVIKIQS